MLGDDDWLGDEEIFEFFKVYSAYNLGLCSYNIIMKNTQDWDDLISICVLQLSGMIATVQVALNYSRSPLHRDNTAWRKVRDFPKGLSSSFF